MVCQKNCHQMAFGSHLPASAFAPGRSSAISVIAVLAGDVKVKEGMWGRDVGIEKSQVAQMTTREAADAHAPMISSTMRARFSTTMSTDDTAAPMRSGHPSAYSPMSPRSAESRPSGMIAKGIPKLSTT